MPVLFKAKKVAGAIESAEKVFDVFEDEWRIGTLRIQGAHTTGEFTATFQPLVEELCDHWIVQMAKFLAKEKKRWKATGSMYYQPPAKRKKIRRRVLSVAS